MKFFNAILGECLKVRNMFEANDPTIDVERYKRIIFEWCSGVNGILHVDLDRSEGWLYVKCKDKDSAGQGNSKYILYASLYKLYYI